MLVDVTTSRYAILVELAYASSQNVTGKPIYCKNACYLHVDAFVALEKAAAIAEPLGLRLKLFDGFRPQEAQWVLWKHMPDPRFVADPNVGSMHSRGIAVDLTLIDGEGHALDMGTAFDAFTPASFHGDVTISSVAQKNRLLFLGIMTLAGWVFNPYEWWHYQLPDEENYPLLHDKDVGLGLMDPNLLTASSL